MTQKEDKLYRLIHSLSTNEKGFFKKYIKREGNAENTLIAKLFDIYNNQKEYNETAIDKAISKSTLIKQEGKIRSLLYQSILESLIVNSKKQLPFDQIISLIQETRILREKNLYHEAKIKLNKAIKIASTSENYGLWEITLHMDADFIPRINPNPETIEKMFQKNLSEREKIEQHKQDEKSVVTLYINTLSFLGNTGLEPLASIQEKAQKAFQEFQINEENLSKRNELLFIASKATVALILLNDDNFRIEAQKLLNKCNENDYRDCLNASKKLGLISNLRVGHKNNFKTQFYNMYKTTCIKLYHEIQKTDKDNLPLAESIIFNLEMQHLLQEKKYESAIKKYKEKIKGKDTNTDNEININFIDIYFELGLIYFYNKNYKETIRTLNQIYLKTNKDYPPIVESEIIFLMMLANIKLQQSDSVEVLANDYITVYQRHQLQLPIRKKIGVEIQKNPFLNESKMIEKIKNIVQNSSDSDIAYFHPILDIKSWLDNQ